MSYDIYCYKSKLDKPNLEEAQAVMELDQNESSSDFETKAKIAKPLIDYNPRFESFEFDYEEISKLKGISIEEAKEMFDQIELNTPDGDLATQITIFGETVSITVPYWYSGEEANEVFKNINEYAKVIRQTVGYFVYDPQTDKVFDPLNEKIFELDLYQGMTEQVEKMKTEQFEKSNKKPWWKFW
jgi:hypothetical protein